MTRKSKFKIVLILLRLVINRNKCNNTSNEWTNNVIDNNCMQKKIGIHLIFSWIAERTFSLIFRGQFFPYKSDKSYQF